VSEQLAQGCYLAVNQAKVEPATLQLPVQHTTITPSSYNITAYVTAIVQPSGYNTAINFNANR